MSMRYVARVVSLTLKETVWPWLTLTSVANPWMLASPAPGPSHTPVRGRSHPRPALDYCDPLGPVTPGPRSGLRHTPGPLGQTPEGEPRNRRGTGRGQLGAAGPRTTWLACLGKGSEWR